MPLWCIYHPPATFEDVPTKQALAKDITTIYTAVGLPAFYVVVEFIEVAIGSTFVGGESRMPDDGKPPFIRIVISNIARRLPDGENERKDAFLKRVDTVLKPHVADMGYDWEYHTELPDRTMWKIQGMIPPPTDSEEEKLWVRENRAVEYPGAYKK